jgi:hypothetical protein
MAEPHEVELTINPEQAFFILTKARAWSEKVPLADPDSGSNPTDDQDRAILEDRADDPTREELVRAIETLNEDAQADLLALLWVGRGTYTLADWQDARKEAAGLGHRHTAQYILETPLAGDYLEEGLAALGYSLEDYELGRL